ncbi:hypothetical protein Ddye_013446 [Dipteronia dyeriana]|uniref:Uncharacterized protein n=1 Tax=Dipteronia dyeriana TaxID=168575 RepID=A0AAE0CJM6_9ROSI|nr:hypothetical protein Ddye_013446 [Dipteronia dyeriana]
MKLKAISDALAAAGGVVSDRDMIIEHLSVSAHLSVMNPSGQSVVNNSNFNNNQRNGRNNANGNYKVEIVEEIQEADLVVDQIRGYIVNYAPSLDMVLNNVTDISIKVSKEVLVK